MHDLGGMHAGGGWEYCVVRSTLPCICFSAKFDNNLNAMVK